MANDLTHAVPVGSSNSNDHELPFDPAISARTNQAGYLPAPYSNGSINATSGQRPPHGYSATRLPDSLNYLWPSPLRIHPSRFSKEGFIAKYIKPYIKPLSVSKTSGDCTICYELYDDTEHVPVVIVDVEGCKGHVFGKTCLIKWLQTPGDGFDSSLYKTCPMCRTPLCIDPRFARGIKDRTLPYDARAHSRVRVGETSETSHEPGPDRWNASDAPLPSHSNFVRLSRSQWYSRPMEFQATTRMPHPSVRGLPTRSRFVELDDETELEAASDPESLREQQLRAYVAKAEAEAEAQEQSMEAVQSPAQSRHSQLRDSRYQESAFHTRARPRVQQQYVHHQEAIPGNYRATTETLLQGAAQQNMELRPPRLEQARPALGREHSIRRMPNTAGRRAAALEQYRPLSDEENVFPGIRRSAVQPRSLLTVSSDPSAAIQPSPIIVGNRPRWNAQPEMRQVRPRDDAEVGVSRETLQGRETMRRH